MKKADPTYMGLYSQIGQYWGEQPGTSGPVYVGAFVMFLFIMGCFIVKGPMKWALLGGTLFSILLCCIIYSCNSRIYHSVVGYHGIEGSD